MDSAPGMKQMLGTMLRGPIFLGNDKKHHKVKDEPEKFFLDYIPRVFGKNTEVKKVKTVEDLPSYNWEKNLEKK